MGGPTGITAQRREAGAAAGTLPLPPPRAPQLLLVQGHNLLCWLCDGLPFMLVLQGISSQQTHSSTSTSSSTSSGSISDGNGGRAASDAAKAAAAQQQQQQAPPGAKQRKPVTDAIKARCAGTVGTWCIDYFTQIEVPAKTAPRGNKTCSMDCNQVGSQAGCLPCLRVCGFGL